MKERDRPFCQIVDGHRLPGSFSEDVYRSGLRYQPEEGDIVIATFPKCGTHWTLQIIRACFRVCRGVTLGWSFLEKLGLDGIQKLSRPRIVTTHLPLHLAPYNTRARYIYVARNPKDCCVSFYNHTKNIPGYGFQDGTFEEYFEIFLDGRTDFGNYYETLRSWYSVKDEPNLLFLTYESIHADFKGSVLKIARHVDPGLADELEVDDAKLEVVLRDASVVNMKKEWEIQFVRKGVVGDWRNYFSEEQSRRLEERFFREMEGTTVPSLWNGTDWLLRAR